MQLRFKKNESLGEVEISMKSSSSTFDQFSYTNMIRELVKSKSKFEESIFEGNFSDEERDKIAELLKAIEEKVVTEVE